jgi:hypothetical protein
MKFMSTSKLFVVGILLAVASLSQADLIVDAGDHVLLADTPDQVISIEISGVGLVTNATVYTETSHATLSPLPVFTSGNITSGTIFDGNNQGGTYDFYDDEYGYADVITDTGTVDGNGVLCFMTVDTTGVPEGTYSLLLTDTFYGNTVVGTDPTVNISYLDGTIEVVPEPVTLALLATGGLALLRRRRQK